MGDADLQAVMTGLQEVLPVLEQAQDASSGSFSASGRERKARRTAEALKTATERVQQASTLLFQLHADNTRRPELFVQLEATAGDLQTALERLAIVEKERQEAIEQLQGARRRSGSHVSPRQAQTPRQVASSPNNNNSGSSALLQEQLDRATKAAEAAELKAELESARAAAEKAASSGHKHQAAVAALTAQELRAEVESAQVAAEKAASSGHKHQAAVASLTGDNVVLVLRAKAAEDEGATLRAEREQLRAALDEQRGPWFDEVRAGVRQKVAAALQQAEALEAKMDSKQAEYNKALAVLNEDKSALRQKLAEAQAEAQYVDLAAATKEDRTKAAEATAENRVHIATVRAMQEECHTYKDLQQRAEERVAGLEAQIALLKDQIASLQVQCHSTGAEVQTQQEVNRQLMSRKQEIEWQLMTALAGNPAAAAGQELGHDALLSDHNFDLSSPLPGALQAQVA